ncbi:riboflavin kinase [Pisolithus croceorrhizus]|nr:riboflavin kinase [Pisolithus croceorrhizus]
MPATHKPPAQTDHCDPAQIQTQSFRANRPSIAGPDVPEPPYPIPLEGVVQRGFGRANLPDESLPDMVATVEPGVYYGYAQVLPPEGQQSRLRSEDHQVWPMVMSLGWNPFYKNERMTAMIFYGYNMRALVLGYIRPELDYTSREALIEDIEIDKKVALASLARPGYKYTLDPFFSNRNQA